jgi:hypothetical protein
MLQIMQNAITSRLQLVIAFLLLGTFSTHAQYYVRGQDPASIRWQQIHTEHFQLIFPEEYAERAAYIADVLEHAYIPASASLEHMPRKVPVIVHNRTVVSNGFVSWAPARIELFTNPPPHNDVHNWHERLAIHEYRHVVQIDKLNQGITGVLAFLFGEHATGAMLGLFLPLWLLEGDAVATETALTHGGRGRQPHFEQGLRAQVMEKGIYSFDKATLGSHKEHVPNHYELGYQLIASGRASYGKDIWSKTIDNAARRPYSIFPKGVEFKKQTGLNIRRHYRQTFKSLDSAWTVQMQKHDYTPYTRVNPDNQLFTNYRSPTFLNDSTLLFVKTGLEDIPHAVLLDTGGQEKLLFTPGFYNSEIFSAGSDLIAWTELRNDPRWEHRSWSEVHTYSLSSGSKRRITSGTRFFSPAVAPRDDRIVVAEVTSLDEYALVIIDAATGEENARIQAPDNAFLMHPTWHPDGESLIAIAQNETGKRIVGIDPNSGVFSTLFHAGHTDISRPRYLANGLIVFNGAFSGIDNVYLLEETSGEVAQLTSSRFGAIDATLSPDGKTLVWSDYSSMGYRAVMHTDGLPETPPLRDVEDHSVAFHKILAAQENTVVSESAVPRFERKVTRYRKGLNLFNIHSWGPFALNIDTKEATPGISLFSQNALSTSMAQFGYEYDLNEELGKFFVRYSYLGLYPVIDITAESGLRRAFYLDQQDERQPFLWRENTISTSISLPLQYRHGPYFFGLNPSLRPGITKVASTDDSPEFFNENEVYTMAYRVWGYWQRRSVMRDIRPRWGQVLDINYRHTPFRGTDMGSVAAARLINFLPGLAQHHSLRISAAYQEQVQGVSKDNTINYMFPNLINYPRGITGRGDLSAWSFSADYAFPLAYPEWTIPSLLYIKRLSINLFADYANATHRVVPDEEDNQEPYLVKDDLWSLGIDFMSDVHVFRFFAPMNIGLRSSYLPGEERFDFRFLFVFDI